MHRTRFLQMTLPPLAAVLGCLVLAGSATAAQAPASALFVAGHAELTPDGERWLQAQVARRADKPQQLVVVKLPGEATTLQERRSALLRDRLAALGVPAQQVYVEAGGSTR